MLKEISIKFIQHIRHKRKIKKKKIFYSLLIILTILCHEKLKYQNLSRAYEIYAHIEICLSNYNVCLN